MNLRALAAGAALALILAVPVSAHFVTPTCGAVTFNETTTGWTAVVQPGDLTFGPFSHDGDSGPYKIAAGSYSYQFVDSAGNAQESGSFTVAACATPSPTASPTDAPRPTPRVIPTPPPTATQAGPYVNDTSTWTYPLIALGFLASFAGMCWRFLRR